MDAYLLDLTQLTAGNHFLGKLIVGSQEALLKDRQQDIMLFCGFNQITAFIITACHGFFHDHIHAVLQQILANAAVRVRERGIDNKIQILAVKQLPVVSIHLTAGIFCQSAGAAILIQFHNGEDITEGIGICLEKCSMDIPSAAALTDDGDFQFLHW